MDTSIFRLSPKEEQQIKQVLKPAIDVLIVLVTFVRSINTPNRIIWSILMVSLLTLASCGRPQAVPTPTLQPLPTQVLPTFTPAPPTATPATPQGRIDAHIVEMQQRALELRKTIWEVDQYAKQTDAMSTLMAYLNASQAATQYRLIEYIYLPKQADLDAVGEEFDYLGAHEFIVTTLFYCGLLEDVDDEGSIESGLSASALQEYFPQCRDAMAYLEQTIPGMFVCQRNSALGSLCGYSLLAESQQGNEVTGTERAADAIVEEPEVCPILLAYSEIRRGPGTQYEVSMTSPNVDSCVGVHQMTSDNLWYEITDLDGNPSGAWVSADRLIYPLEWDPVPAVDYPASPTQMQAQQPPQGCSGGCTTYPTWCAPPIKGNIGFNSGERIYHVPGGEWYDSTEIDPAYGERWFCTESEAQAAGWRRSGS